MDLHTRSTETKPLRRGATVGQDVDVIKQVAVERRGCDGGKNGFPGLQLLTIGRSNAGGTTSRAVVRRRNPDDVDPGSHFAAVFVDHSRQSVDQRPSPADGNRHPTHGDGGRNDGGDEAATCVVRPQAVVQSPRCQQCPGYG